MHSSKLYIYAKIKNPERKKLLGKASHISNRVAYILSVLLMVLEISCSQTRHLESGTYLLNRTKIKVDSKHIDPADMKKFERQSPNKTILGVIKFHLFIYNLASPKKNGFFSRSFRKIGEEPVIWDSVLTNKTVEQFAIFAENKGYYHAKVTDTVKFRKKRVNIKYSVSLNKPYIIRSIDYVFEDQSISKVILKDSINRLIKVGDRFDKDVLQKERQRLEDLLKNDGYFSFSKEYVFFEARLGSNRDSVDLSVIVKENISGDIDPITKVRKHYQYKINNTYIYPNYSMKAASLGANLNKTDTVNINNSFLVYSNGQNIKPNTLIARNMCMPGNLYSLGDVKKTYNGYISMGFYRLVNIYFIQPHNLNLDTSKYKYIDCFIELSPRKTNTYQIEGVITNTEGDLGVSTNITYNNYNFLHGAEHFQLKLTGAIEGLKNRTKNKYASMQEYGIEPSLTLPVFIVPFPAQQFVKKFNPKTVINLSYSYQDHPYYIRYIENTLFGYEWKGNSYNQHTLYPFDISYVYLPKGGITDSAFKSQIQGSSIENSYKNHAILATRYQFEFSNQDIEKLKDFEYVKYDIESAGFLTHSLLKAADPKYDSTIFGIRYFQYIINDIDLRYNNQISRLNKMAYRLYIGIGHAYGNSDNLPSEKMFFAGGPNGIRAWPIYTLGPGSDDSSFIFGTRLGDYKLEANAEYRFKLFWRMEGALFVDAGNIWTRKNYPNHTNDIFKWNTFYKEIAVGSGIGLRFDFSYLLFRTDFGFKLRNPGIQSGSRWIDFNSAYKNSNKFIDRWTFQFGIGYPF